MNLSKEAEDYAKSVIDNRCGRLLYNLEEDLRNIPPNTGIRTRSREANYLDCVNQMAMIIIDTYKEAFKTDGTALTLEDIEEIGDEIYRIGNDAIEDFAGSQEIDVLNTIVRVFKEDLSLEMKKGILERKKEEDRKVAQNLVLENQKKQYRVLNRIYVESEGIIGRRVEEDTIIEKEGLDATEVFNICRYLSEEGLIKPDGFRSVSITNLGINEITSSANHPERATAHFPPAVIQHFHGTVYGVQSGGHHNTQNIQVNINPNFNENFSKLMEFIKSSSLSEVQKEEAIEDLERVAKLAQKEKTPDVVEAAKKRLDLVKTTIEVGTSAATIAMPYLQYLYHWFVG